MYHPFPRNFLIKHVGAFGPAMLADRRVDRNWSENGVPSGHLSYVANWKMAIEIVDLPIENGDFP